MRNGLTQGLTILVLFLAGPGLAKLLLSKRCLLLAFKM